MTDMKDDIEEATQMISSYVSEARQMISSFVRETSSLSTKKTCWDTLTTYAALLDYYEKLRLIYEDLSDCEDEDDVYDFEASVKKITEGIQRLIN